MLSTGMFCDLNSVPVNPTSWNFGTLTWKAATFRRPEPSSKLTFTPPSIVLAVSVPIRASIRGSPLGTRADSANPPVLEPTP